jgi:hypothetical protein
MIQKDISTIFVFKSGHRVKFARVVFNFVKSMSTGVLYFHLTLKNEHQYYRRYQFLKFSCGGFITIKGVYKLI